VSNPVIPNPAYGDITVPDAVDALAAGVDIAAVADAAGITPIGLAIAGIAWLAEHRDEISNADHARISAVLAAAVAPRTGGDS
jgi:hypothetical protein